MARKGLREVHISGVLDRKIDLIVYFLLKEICCFLLTISSHL
jgi:hypothetical protein